MEVRVCSPVAKGDELTIQYTSSLLGASARIPQFRKNWTFTCNCLRCVDCQEEMGTFLSAILCKKHEGGLLLPRDDGCTLSWFCTSDNNHTETNEDVEPMIDKLDETIHTNVCFASSPLDWEKILEELQKTLHKDHYLCLDVKRLLVQLYGWKEGFKLHELSDEVLKRKIDLCENYVSAYSKVEPSLYTKWRGRIFEEMVGPIAMLAKRKYEAKQINKGEYNCTVVKCLGLIRQAVKCRQFERPAAAAATEGIGGNKAAIAAIMKEFNDIVSSVEEV